MSELKNLRKANRARQEYWPGHEHCADIEFRCIEFSGEAGELADSVKKLLRLNRGIAGNVGKSREDIETAILEEVGDVLITLDALADVIGIDLRVAVVEKFNKTSRKVSVPVLMHPKTMEPVGVAGLSGPFTFDD